MNDWRERLRDLLVTDDLGTQARIVDELRRSGFRVTQGTVSRELSQIGASKVDGAYRMPSATVETGAPIHRCAAAGPHLAVVQTEPAFAHIIGKAIDDAQAPGILGTVAGDDTVFVALDSPRALGELRRLLGVTR